MYQVHLYIPSQQLRFIIKIKILHLPMWLKNIKWKNYTMIYIYMMKNVYMTLCNVFQKYPTFTSCKCKCKTQNKPSCFLHT